MEEYGNQEPSERCSLYPPRAEVVGSRARLSLPEASLFSLVHSWPGGLRGDSSRSKFLWSDGRARATCPQECVHHCRIPLLTAILLESR